VSPQSDFLKKKCFDSIEACPKMIVACGTYSQKPFPNFLKDSENSDPPADDSEEVVQFWKPMTSRRFSSLVAAAVGMPAFTILGFAVVFCILLAVPGSPARVFVEQLASNNSDAVGTAGRVVLLNRYVLMPAILAAVMVTFTLLFVRASRIGMLASVAAAAVIAGWPSLATMLLLALLYSLFAMVVERGTGRLADRSAPGNQRV